MAAISSAAGSAADEGGPLRQAAVARALHIRRTGAQAEVTRILEGAYRLIRRDGTVEPSMRDLLTEIGISTRSFYRHFPAKDDFLLVLVEDLQARLTATIAQRMAAEPEPAARVREWLLGILDQAVDPETAVLGRPFVVQAARLREAYPDVYRTTGVALLGLLQRAIDDAVDAGHLHSSNPRADARVIFHLTMAVMQSHVLDRTIPTQSEQDAVLDFAFRALRERPDDRRPPWHPTVLT
jgi:AcrR family transcriptional regulator